jgi:hypothetical protein
VLVAFNCGGDNVLLFFCCCHKTKKPHRRHCIDTARERMTAMLSVWVVNYIILQFSAKVNI